MGISHGARSQLEFTCFYCIPGEKLEKFVVPLDNILKLSGRGCNCNHSWLQRHTQGLCLSLFTLAIAAGNKGFLAIGGLVKSL